MGGLGGIAKAGGMSAAFSGVSTYMQTGSLGQAGTAMAGAAIGVGIGAGLTAIGVPPPLSGMIGQMIGGYAQTGLNKAFGLTGGYKRGRKKSVGILEGHLSGEGAFDFGAPSGLKKWMNRAIGGKEKVPTEKRYNKLVATLGSASKLSRLWGAGVDPATMVGLGTGQIKGQQAANAYRNINMGRYGSATGPNIGGAATLGVGLADGGIVTRPTRALIGERGPEMVIPLHEQRKKDAEMLDEMKKQNNLMVTMIKTQKESGNPTIRLDGKKISESVGQNFYDIGSGIG
jgi:hypothetical protein